VCERALFRAEEQRQPDECHKKGACDTLTGACDNPAKDDGSTCDKDHDPCSEGDHCETGACVAGAPKSCGVYSCDKGTGLCLLRCDSVSDCTSDYVCDPQHRCVPPPDTRTVSDTGCSFAPSGGDEGSMWRVSALALLALGALAGRRRGKPA
jgi:MYXO-CTERM domain-containing protein